MLRLVRKSPGLEVSSRPSGVAGKSVSVPCPATQKYNFAMSRELADGLAVTAMAVRMEVSIHAMAGYFALCRQRARRPPRLEREVDLQGSTLKKENYRVTYGFTELREKPAGRGRDGRGSTNQNVAGM